MQQQDRVMSGDLQMSLQYPLKTLALGGKTGRLFVSSGPETLSLSMRKGQIVGLHEEGMIQADVLRMLCLSGKLDPTYAQSVRELARGDMQLALTILVERGGMSADEMQRRFEFAVAQAMSHALRWEHGRFEFLRQVVDLESRIHPLEVDSLLLEALRQADEWEEIMATGVTSLARTTVAAWRPEVSKDVGNMGLSREMIDVLCLCNGEFPLQAIALCLMVPEARIAHMLSPLLEMGLIEVVDTALETELQQDLSNVIIRCQYTLAQQRHSSPEHHLLGLLKTLSECINGLLIHHGTYARSLRGRGQVSSMEIVRYLEGRFGRHLHLLAKQFPLLDTVSFNYGLLDCNDILTLSKIIKGQQLEEHYWEAVQGLVAFLRMTFEEVIRDEVGNSHTGRHLDVVWKGFLDSL